MSEHRSFELTLIINFHRRGTWWRWVVMTLVGAVWALLSLPQGATRLAAREGWGWAEPFARFSVSVNSLVPEFALLVAAIGVATVGFLCAVVVLGVRYRSPDLAWIGVGAAALSAASVHIVSWVVVAIRAVLTPLLDVISFVASLFSGWSWAAWITVIVVTVLIVALLKVSGADVPDWASSTFTFLWLTIVGLTLVWLGIQLTLWLLTIPFVLILVAVGLMEMLGRLVVDQFIGSTKAGRGLLGTLMGAVGVGTSLSMLMLIGDLLGAHSLYPRAVQDWVAAWIVSDNPPEFDALVCLLVVGICAAAVISNLLRPRPEPTGAEFMRSIVFTFWGMVFAGGIAAIGHHTELDPAG